ncbi:MAG: hypothetical protein ACRCWU_00025 [Metamycoplasmataceae bacterium]
MNKKIDLMLSTPTMQKRNQSWCLKQIELVLRTRRIRKRIFISSFFYYLKKKII